MALKVLRGEDVSEAFLAKLDPVDDACYEPEYRGEPMNTVVRWRKNARSFVFVLEEATDELVGYINFFPCEKDLHLDNLSRSPVIRDDDILPEEVAPWRTDENHVFVISICVLPSHQGGETIRLLTDGFIACLNELQDEGFPITDITATAVSRDGRASLQRLFFREVRRLEDGNTVYICDGPRLERLLENDLYFKSYRDDLWLLLPFVEHEANLRVANFLEDRAEERAAGTDAAGTGAAGACAASPDPDRALAETAIAELRDYFAYECSNEVVDDLEIAYVGSYDFLHTTDEYAGQDTGEEVVIGTPRGHAILVAHRKTHMFVLAVLLSDYPCSVTQMEDQVSYDYLKILDPAGSGSFVSFYEHLRLTLGLHRCGQPRCILYLSNRPRDNRELQNMLAGEAYVNFGSQYHLQSPEIGAMAAENRAQFDDYEAYFSSRAIAYVAKDFSDSAEERVCDFADYLFIVILVLFQNTALSKVNRRVTSLLEANGDISPQLKLEIDREHGRTVRFWEVQNFKYLATQTEAMVIREAFLNQELRDTYNEHQEYLEHLVTVKDTINEARNGMVINILATLLAIIQVEPFFTALMQGMYESLGIEATYATNTVYAAMFGGVPLVVLALAINRRRRLRAQRRCM